MHKFICVLIASGIFLAAGSSAIYGMLTDTDVKNTELITGYSNISLNKTGGLSIRNTGNIPCYVRIAIDISDSAKKEKCTFTKLPGNNWTAYYQEGSGGMKGYYYYTLPLMKNEETSKLFTAIQYADSSVSGSDIDIYAESIICGNYLSYVQAWTSLEKQ